MPVETLAVLFLSPDEAASEVRRILAIHWYTQGRISQGTGASLAGLSRHQFIDALSAAHVPAIQATADEVREELADAVGASGENQSQRLRRIGK